MWKIKYHPDAEKDLKKLDDSVKKIVLKGIIKVSENPLPKNKGGYGKPLGNKNKNNLTNLLKIKYKKIGIRVVYKLFRTKNEMYILVISARAENEVYTLAGKRKF